VALEGLARRPRVAVLGGGMAGLAAAWRLSEPGWRRRFGSITVYQRGWRLGGKGASSRGHHGRIEEHGLHVWLGWYDNAFRLLRECYSELDRATSDPEAPIRTWRQALLPASDIGLEERDDGRWRHWLGRFSPNDLEPGDPHVPVRPLTATDYLRRGLRLIVDFVDSLGEVGEVPASGRVVLSTRPEPPLSGVATTTAGVRAVTPAALLAITRLVRDLAARRPPDGLSADLVPTLDSLQVELATVVGADPARRRTWQQVGLTIAVVRGLLADGALDDPAAFDRLDEEDFRDWIRRHGAGPEIADGPFVRGIYDLVFADAEGDPRRPGFGAATGLVLSTKMLFEYRGAIFWKMAAGMGDVVFAPLYQALRARGVEIDFFCRVDALHLSADRQAVDAISVGRQVRLRRGVERYEPLVRVRGLPCFPDAPLVDQLEPKAAQVRVQPLESHWCTWPDAERRTLRRGTDFDIAVLAIPIGMAGVVCRELMADRPEWRDMVANVKTVATRAFQAWLREDERDLGWPVSGSTLTGYAQPFDTGASMSHVIGLEDWPDGGAGDDRPGSVFYFCDTHDAPAAPDLVDAGVAAEHHERVRRAAVHFLDRQAGHLLPEAVTDRGFRWELLCGGEPDGLPGRAAFDSQFWTANVDPADRYVQSQPGTAKHRLRPDESGYDNLFLAGDWTDSGLNAGCIEAAVVSGLQAANGLLGRGRHHRIGGTVLG
jgi:uncharacterized protein with NAD-binding domain and iron-sulfur cluster